MTISEALRAKIELLEKWDEAYHSKGESLVSDEKYDLVKDYVLRSLPPDSPELARLLNKVGHPVISGWAKERHIIAMGSQNKVSNEDAIKKFWEDTMTAIGKKQADVVLQHKIDGFSLELQYKAGMLDKAVIRGDGSLGEVITPNARKFRNLPQILPIKKDVVVRAEGHISKANFDKIQKETKGKYKNGRNAASGISRRFGGQYCEYIEVMAYDINAKVVTEQQKIEVLRKLGYITVPTYLVSDLPGVIVVYRDYRDNKREKLEYEIDGLVLKLDSLEHQEHLGVDHNKPKGQVALKFNSEQAITEVRAILDQVGRTGKITPIAILNPVDLMGSTVTKASLHNYAWIEENEVSPGAEVVIEKKGDIIPQVVDVLTPGRGYQRPTKCPACGGDLEWDGTNLWCFNAGCKGREVARITYWMQVLDMKGFSWSFAEKLWDIGKVKCAADLYGLAPDDICSVDGIGVKTAKSFIETLKATGEMYLEQFIVALGIPGLSKEKAKVLVETFGTWGAIKALKVSDLMVIPGFAEVSSKSVLDGISKIQDMADQLLEVIKIRDKKKGSLTGFSFCVTGSLASMGRKEFEQTVVENGGTLKSVGAGLSYLVTNTPESGSGKNAKVAALNSKQSDPDKRIKIIDEKQFLDMIEKRVSASPPSQEVVNKGSTEDPKLDFEPLFE